MKPTTLYTYIFLSFFVAMTLCSWFALSISEYRVMYRNATIKMQQQTIDKQEDRISYYRGVIRAK